jgi:1,4-dihydroxy-2-naphthoate octaprenyltransferase
MKKGILITSLMALFSGLWLLYLSVGKGNLLLFVFFVLLGLASILAALKYTIGHNPFGYKGLGDLMVFIFFGMVSVTGSFFLLSKSFNLNVLLPAASIGFLSTGVLNINNLRDVENDRISGKNTLVVKMGGKTGRLYHLFLINAGILSMVAYLIIINKYLGTLLLIIPVVLLYFHSKKIALNKVPKALDPELKRLALITLLISIITASVLIF